MPVIFNKQRPFYAKVASFSPIKKEECPFLSRKAVMTRLTLTEADTLKFITLNDFITLQ